MKPAKLMLYLLVLAFGSATAGDPPADTPSEGMTTDSTTSASTMYEVDEDRDGRTDSELILEQSDSLA